MILILLTFLCAYIIEISKRLRARNKEILSFSSTLPITDIIKKNSQYGGKVILPGRLRVSASLEVQFNYPSICLLSFTSAFQCFYNKFLLLLWLQRLASMANQYHQEYSLIYSPWVKYIQSSIWIIYQNLFSNTDVYILYRPFTPGAVRGVQ